MGVYYYGHEWKKLSKKRLAAGCSFVFVCHTRICFDIFVRKFGNCAGEVATFAKNDCTGMLSQPQPGQM